jgi:hypothetical protein
VLSTGYFVSYMSVSEAIQIESNKTDLLVKLLNIIVSLVLGLNDNWMLLQVLRCGHLLRKRRILKNEKGCVDYNWDTYGGAGSDYKRRKGGGGEEVVRKGAGSQLIFFSFPRFLTTSARVR